MKWVYPLAIIKMVFLCIIPRGTAHLLETILLFVQGRQGIFLLEYYNSFSVFTMRFNAAKYTINTMIPNCVNINDQVPLFWINKLKSYKP